MTHGPRCDACGGRIVLVNLDKLRGIVGLTMGYVHVSRWRRHRVVIPEALR